MTRRALPRWGVLLATLALVSGCGRCTGGPAQPAAPATSAPKVEEAPPKPKTTQVTYVLDAARSKLRIRRATNGMEKPLEIPGVSGTATVDKGRLKAISVEVDITTLRGDERAQDLKDVDWLNVVDHPKAIFDSTLVDDQTTGLDSHQIGGIIELHGQPLDYGFPANVAITDTEVQGSAELYLDAKRFGVPQLTDTVYTVIADLVFVRPAK
jgi:polyisoprenoid-binding protein YceI